MVLTMMPTLGAKNGNRNNSEAGALETTSHNNAYVHCLIDRLPLICAAVTGDTPTLRDVLSRALTRLCKISQRHSRSPGLQQTGPQPCFTSSPTPVLYCPYKTSLHSTTVLFSPPYRLYTQVLLSHNCQQPTSRTNRKISTTTTTTTTTSSL